MDCVIVVELNVLTLSKLPNKSFVGFCEQLPIEDLCSLTSQSLTVTLTAAVPESTEDVLLKGFAILGMEDERIETAQQVSDAE